MKPLQQIITEFNCYDVKFFYLYFNCYYFSYYCLQIFGTLIPFSLSCAALRLLAGASCNVFRYTSRGVNILSTDAITSFIFSHRYSFLVSAGYQVGVPAPTTRVVAMDDEEPCWKSLGYCRDLGRQPIQDAEVASPLPHTLAARSLPSVGNPEFAKGADSWNLDLCEYALKCDDPACHKFHHVIERRCRKFALLGNSVLPGCEGGCSQGLHVKAADVCQTYNLNLLRTEANLVEAFQLLKAQSSDERATYVRIAVWNFAAVRTIALRRFLAQLLLVHELLLPDRDFCSFHLLTVLRVINSVSPRCPKLRWIVFRDGTAESVWKAGASGNQAEVSQSPVSTGQQSMDV